MSIQHIMSHNIAVPLQVRFTPVKRKWTLRNARIVGSADGFHLRDLLPGTTPIIEPLSAYPLSVRLLEPGPRGSMKESETLYSLGFGDHVEALKERYAPGGTLLTSAIYGTPLLELLVSDLEERPKREHDPWQMREEFLNLPQSGDALASFLTKWGIWSFESLSEITAGAMLHRLGSPVRYYAVPELIWERQTFYKAALSGKPKDWLTLHARVPAPQRQLKPPFLATVDSLCSTAIETTITMDKLRDVPYRICAKEDCGRVFELRTKHDKQFCSYSCAHLTSVRRGRAKQKAKKTTKKAGA